MAIQVSGTPDLKRLASYLKKSHKERSIHVCNYQGEMLITDKHLFMKVLPSHEIAQYAIPQVSVSDLGECFFPKGDFTVQTGGVTFISDAWKKFSTLEPIATLKATRFIYEAPHWKKPSEFYRKLVYTIGDEEHAIWIDKAMLDVFSTDPDDLDQFILELCNNGSGRLVRVSARYGHTAYLAPAQNVG